MTVRDRLVTELYNCGMFKQQAELIVNTYAAENGDFEQRQNEPESEYPSFMIVAWMIVIKDRAAEFVRVTCPKAWYLPLLERSTDR